MDPLDTALRGPTPSQLTPANLAALSPEAAPPISYAGSDAAGASAYGSGNLRSNYDYSALRSVTDSSASPLPNPHQREAGPASLPGHDSNSIYTSSGAGARLLSTSPPSISSFSASTSAAPAGAPQTKSELRAIRQMELRRQTQEIHRELEELEREEEAARARAGGETGTNARLRELEEEVRLLRAQQAQVQTQLRPSIDEDAPPSYSA
ncbi:hypothetical protein MKEN_00803100 [Mycena kentingensis (nom. inval.)]|nr:hypothetical protein MKEN_00803100 [Mycena kentingensis (nom. inval.)]